MKKFLRKGNKMFNFFKKDEQKRYKFKVAPWSGDAEAFESFIKSKKDLEELYGGKIKFVDVKRDWDGYICFILFEVEEVKEVK